MVAMSTMWFAHPLPLPEDSKSSNKRCGIYLRVAFIQINTRKVFKTINMDNGTFSESKPTAKITKQFPNTPKKAIKANKQAKKMISNLAGGW
uniref:Uncharacterized protein n=1 Tax=Romanomermis culicivorax TaxID=13658 RepID=A0A915IZB0_ROMCU